MSRQLRTAQNSTSRGTAQLGTLSILGAPIWRVLLSLEGPQKAVRIALQNHLGLEFPRPGAGRCNHRELDQISAVTCKGEIQCVRRR